MPRFLVGAVRGMPKAPRVAALDGSRFSEGSGLRKAPEGFNVDAGV